MLIYVSQKCIKIEVNSNWTFPFLMYSNRCSNILLKYYVMIHCPWCTEHISFSQSSSSINYIQEPLDFKFLFQIKHWLATTLIHTLFIVSRSRSRSPKYSYVISASYPGLFQSVSYLFSSSSLVPLFRKHCPKKEEKLKNPMETDSKQTHVTLKSLRINDLHVVL